MRDFSSLPVYKHREEIINALREHQVIIVESPTGSGKTTQIPLILKEAGLDADGVIGITQPRRIATLSVCDFIKRQLNDQGSLVAYTMRFDDTSTEDTRIKIMTDGILLQEIKNSPLLKRYSVLMIDEAHERSLNIDFILGLLKEIIRSREDLKIIISSATINTKTFSAFFNNAPIISIDSKPFPVEVRYVPLSYSRDESEEYFETITELVKGARTAEDGGDVLIFLPGEGEIKDAIAALKASDFADSLIIYPLYGRLSKEEQEAVFTPTPAGKTKVVVSTNIAETSITIDGIRTVIDSGWAKTNFYNQRNFTSALIPVPISRSSAEQRRGRAGRTAPGVCYRLYSQESFEKRSEYTEEEILHSDLAEVVLRMSELGILNTHTFPFITAPLTSALRSAEETLILIGAINEDHTLTHIGELMIKFPLLPRLSRVIVEAIMNYPNVISAVITAVAYLSTKSPFVMPPGEELTARDRHRALSDPVYGDFVMMITLYKKYIVLKASEQKSDFCRKNYLDQQTMDEIVHIKLQLEDIVSSLGFPLSEGGNVSDYFCCLASGLRQYVCKKIDRYSFCTLRADKIMIHPGSAWFRNVPEYILAGEIVQTTKMYARTVSPLRYDWLCRVDKDLPEKLGNVKGRKEREKEEFRSRKRAEAEGLERYKGTINGREAYYIPQSELSTVKNRSNKRFYLVINGYISRQPLLLSRLDNEVSLIPRVKYPLSKWPTGTFSLSQKDRDKIREYITYLLKPAIRKGKKEFDYLSLRESNGRYALIPQKSIGEAAKDSVYALSSLLDQLPQKEQSLRRYIDKSLIEILHYLDLED